MVRIPRLLAVATLALFAAPALAQAPIKIVGLVELSGTGATSGTNFDNGVKLAVKEIKDPKTQAVLSTWKKGQLVASFPTLQADRTTSCGWPGATPAGNCPSWRRWMRRRSCATPPGRRLPWPLRRTSP